mgnify:CR=1 FL=1
MEAVKIVVDALVEAQRASAPATPKPKNGAGTKKAKPTPKKKVPAPKKVPGVARKRKSPTTQKPKKSAPKKPKKSAPKKGKSPTVAARKTISPAEHARNLSKAVSEVLASRTKHQQTTTTTPPTAQPQGGRVTTYGDHGHKVSFFYLF